MMRILWFTNYPTFSDPALQFEKPYSGITWVDALESALKARTEISLSVAFNNHKIKSIQKVQVGKITYYSIPAASNKWIRWKNRFFCRLEKPVETQKYLEVIRDFQPDLIQIFGSENNFGRIVSATEIPVIIHLQGILNAITKHWFDGLTRYESIRYARLQDLINGRSFLHKYRLIEKRAEREKSILAGSRQIIGRTAWDRHLINILSPRSTYFHCNEILRGEFYNHQWKKPEDDVLKILSVMNEELYKGLDVVFNTAAILNAKTVRIKWTIAGISPDSRLVRLVEKKLKKRSDSLGIHYPGKLNAQQLIENMLNADVFVHPSYIDNSPNSLCEAMMLGMPVIASYAGGIPSMVEPGQNGFLIQPGDPFVLASLLLILHKDPALASKIGENARKTALYRHNRDTIVNDLLTIYSKTIKHRSTDEPVRHYSDL